MHLTDTEIRDIIKRSGMNIRQFAQRYNIKYGTIQNWLSKTDRKRECKEFAAWWMIAIDKDPDFCLKIIENNWVKLK